MIDRDSTPERQPTEDGPEHDPGTCGPQHGAGDFAPQHGAGDFAPTPVEEARLIQQSSTFVSVEEEAARQQRDGRWGRIGLLLLTLILLVGAAFRFLNVDWDEGEHLHPDERYMTMVTGAIRTSDSPSVRQQPPPGCTAWGGYFDSYCSPLNPYNHQGFGSYAYGTLPLFSTRVVGEWLSGACVDPAVVEPAAPGFPGSAIKGIQRAVAGLLFDDVKGCVGERFTDYGHVHLLGRMLSALADLGTLLFSFFIGRRLYGRWVGLLAAALYCLAVLPIQQSHFYTVDSFAGFFIAAAGFFAVRAAQGGGWRDFALAGLGLGLGLACKVSVWPFAAVIALAALLYFVRSNQSTSTEGRAGGPSLQVLDWLMVLCLIIFLFLVAAVAVFGIWSAPKLAFFFGIALLAAGSVAFYVVRPGRDATRTVPPESGDKRALTGISVDGALGRLLFAGMVAFLAFRVAQPYAFVGTNFDVAKWEAPEYDWLRNNVPEIWYTLNDKLPEPVRALLLPDPRFISTLGSVNKQLTGEQDVPWGHQWTNRLPFLFPWTNMVIWGMGLPLGLIAWAGWGVATWELWRGVRRRQHLLPWSWATILFFYQGTQWVKSIRYLLPVYPFLILLGAWLLVRLWRLAAERLSTRRPQAGRWSRQVAAIQRLPLVIVMIGTLLWAWGFSRIYSEPVTRNSASRWMVEHIPTAVVLHYQASEGEETLFLRVAPTFVYEADGIPNIASFSLPQDGVVTGVTFTHLSDPNLDAAAESFQVRLATDAGGQDVLAQAERRIHLEQTEQRLGDSQHFELDPVRLSAGQEVYLITQATSGAPIRSDTTVIANEYPDDSLPTRVDGRDPFGGLYRGLEGSGDGKTHWDLNEDSSKLSQAVEWLDEADVIALSSNRGYASIPRLPSRYPLAITYYRALFNEELGFELIGTFGAYPTIGPFQFPDQETPFTPAEPSLIEEQLGAISIRLPPAEEAFSVYDHPQVFLFGKTDEYSRQRVEKVLGEVDLSQVVWMKPTEATLAPTALMLTQEQQAAQQSGGTWTEIFDAGDWLNRSPWLSVLVWWMLIQAVGLLGFPVLFAAVPGLYDRGWPLAKTLGLLVWATLIWLLTSLDLLTFSRPAIFWTLLLVALVGGMAAWRQRHLLTRWAGEQRRVILISELLFSGTFLLFLLIRYGNPDLWHPVMGGERPMDFAYLNAVIKSTHFPPYDPWFAGGYMNYYYFGFVIVGTSVKLLGILPEIAYNLILPTFFALTATGAFSIALNLVASTAKERAAAGPAHTTEPPRVTHHSSLARRAIIAGLIAALFVTVLGNLTEIQVVANGLHELGSRDFQFKSTIPGLEPLVTTVRGLIKNSIGGEPLPWRPEWPYWNPSRAIPHPDGEAPPITEFPYFTFLYSDLHAHLLVLPLTTLALGLLLNWVLDRGFWQLKGRRWISATIGLAMGGLVIGSLRPTNTWDYVTYLGLAPLALIVGFGIHREHREGLNRIRLNLETVREGVVAVGGRFLVIAGLSTLIFLPYISHYATASSGFDLWTGSKTPVWAYFGVHGLFLFPILTWLLLADPWRRLWGDAPNGDGDDDPNPAQKTSGRTLSIVIITLLATLFAFVAGYQVALMVLPFGLLSLFVLLREDVRPAERFVALIIGVGLLLTLWVEVGVLNSGDVGRMNTVFKFYLQAWVLFGIAGAVCTVWIWQRQNQPLRTLSARAFAPAEAALPAFVAPAVENAGNPGHSTDVVPAVANRAELARAAWRAWKIVLALLVGLAALYPVVATRAKINDRWAREVGPGLDSLAWMTVVNDTQFGPGAPEGRSYPLQWDYEALMWLRENVSGSPVVAEGARAQPYRSLRARVATYTGLPIIIGYPWHETQQRSFIKTDLIGRRERDVDQLFDTSDPWLAREILDRYQVRLVYLGDLERITYDPAGIAKFELMEEMGLLHSRYSNPGVTIYEVVR